MSEKKNANDVNSVWPGLNHYNESESARFFGRKAETQLICETILRQQICTVYGPSGVGKTSLVLAGVFPKIRQIGDWLPVRIRLDHSRDADSYALQVEKAVLKATSDAKLQRNECAALEQDKEETLWEWFHRNWIFNAFGVRQQIVILIDQFEEIFQSKIPRTSLREWFAALSDLAENTIPKNVAKNIAKIGNELAFNIDEQPWRVVLSIREDFLPRLEEVADEFPIFKRNRISVVALSRDQALEAINGPGADILTPEVAESIVNIVESDQRVDPTILSLMCRELDIQRQKDGRETIDQSMLSKYGDQILPRFYDENMSAVSAKTRAVLEEQLTTSDGFRAKLSITDAVEEGVPKEEYEHLEKNRILHIEHGGKTVWLEFSHDKLAELAKDFRVKRKEREAAEKLRRENEEQLKRQEEEAERLRLENDRQKRKTRFWCWVAMFLGVSLSFVLCYARWRWLQDYDAYYSDFAKIWGIPEGIGKLVEKDVEQRRCSFHFCFHAPGWFRRRSYKRPYLVEAVSGAKDADGKFIRTTFHTKTAYFGDADIMRSNLEGIRPATWMMGLTNNVADNSATLGLSANEEKVPNNKHVRRLFHECRKVSAWEYTYDKENGRRHGLKSATPISEKSLDNEDRAIWVLQYFAIGASGNDSNKVISAHYVDPQGRPLIPNSDLYVNFSFASNGIPVKISTARYTGGETPLVDSFLFESHNRRICSVSTPKIMNGNSSTNQNVTLVEMLFENNGLSEERFGNAEDGEQTSYRKGWRRIRKYSASGNLESVFCTTNMSETTDVKESDWPDNFFGMLPCWSVCITNDTNGRLSLEKRFKVDWPGESKRVFVVECWENGNPMPMSISLHDENLTDVTNRYSISKIENHFDWAGNLERQDFFTPSNHCNAFNCEGVHHVRYLYNAPGCSVTNVKYFAHNESLIEIPTNGPNGVHEVRMEYDWSENLVGQYFFDGDGNATPNKFGSIGYGFDSKGIPFEQGVENLVSTARSGTSSQQEVQVKDEELFSPNGISPLSAFLAAISNETTRIDVLPDTLKELKMKNESEKVEEQKQRSELYRVNIDNKRIVIDVKESDLDEADMEISYVADIFPFIRSLDPVQRPQRKRWPMQAVW